MNMRNQHKTLVGVLLTILMAGFAGEGFAQQVTTPYSMYGYGMIGDRATSMQRQMGGVGVAMNSGRQINAMNPASYASIDSLTFLFDMGADVSILWSEEGKTRRTSTGGGLDYLTMQFPICKFMGGSAGLLPYTSVGYAFGNEIEHGTVENNGSGGINMAYLGLAGTYAGAAFGVNISYNFGNIVNNVYSSPSTVGRTLTEHVMQIRDWDIQLGAQYTARLNRYDRMTVGMTYSPKKSLHGSTWVTLQEMTLETKPDTVAFSKMTGKYQTPNMIGAGVSYKHERVSRWMVEFDFMYQMWSKVKYEPLYNVNNPDQVVFKGMQFADRIRYAVGGEWVPKVRGSYMERNSYRIGAYYCDDYLRLQGNRVREYGVTAGVGFHAPSDKTMINLGFEWKQRRAFPNALISENYFNITLGVNFNELWFWKRKIK